MNEKPPQPNLNPYRALNSVCIACRDSSTLYLSSLWVYQKSFAPAWTWAIENWLNIFNGLLPKNLFNFELAVVIYAQFIFKKMKISQLCWCVVLMTYKNEKNAALTDQ